jgi:hypothetical protein
MSAQDSSSIKINSWFEYNTKESNLIVHLNIKNECKDTIYLPFVFTFVGINTNYKDKVMCFPLSIYGLNLISIYPNNQKRINNVLDECWRGEFDLNKNIKFIEILPNRENSLRIRYPFAKKVRFNKKIKYKVDYEIPYLASPEFNTLKTFTKSKGCEVSIVDSNINAEITPKLVSNSTPGAFVFDYGNIEYKLFNFYDSENIVKNIQNRIRFTNILKIK